MENRLSEKERVQLAMQIAKGFAKDIDELQKTQIAMQKRLNDLFQIGGQNGGASNS